jgi:hypothetical protein
VLPIGGTPASKLFDKVLTAFDSTTGTPLTVKSEIDCGLVLNVSISIKIGAAKALVHATVVNKAKALTMFFMCFLVVVNSSDVLEKTPLLHLPQQHLCHIAEQM